MPSVKTFIILVFSILIISSCKQAPPAANESFSISVRIPKDPNFLNPLKSSAITETIINQYIFLPLANYHPTTQQLIPVLLESIPNGVEIKDGPNANTLMFHCKIKDAAKWGDGQPITGYDYYFTYHSIGFEPLKINPALRSVFKEMKSVEVNEENPKEFWIYVDQAFLLAKELALIAELLPEHLYDPSYSLRNYIKHERKEISDSLQTFIDFFNHSDCGRLMVEGSGPYEISSWQTNQKISLKRKNDYWGNKIDDNPYLSAYPEAINFAVFPSENTALTELKSGTLDVMYGLSGNSFSRLQADDRLNEILNFYNPTQLKYYYLGINNKSVFFEDPNARKAFAHLVDIDAFIKNQESGLGKRTVGPILPFRSYYNDTLKLISPDLKKAKSLFEKAGWKDSDANGILEKKIDGEWVEMKPIMLITGSKLGKNLSLIIQEKAKMAGVDIQLVTKNAKLVRKEISSGNFDLYPTGKTIGLFPEDLYQAWHTDNNYPGGSNKFGVGNKTLDALIDSVRTSSDSTMIDGLYRKIQAEIHREQFMVFLYSPTNNIAVNQRLNPLITIKKPGFFLNAFETDNLN